MTTYSVDILLRVDPDFRSHYDPDASYVSVSEFDLETDGDDHQILNCVFDITNSYPEEPNGCAGRHLDLVKSYRAGRNRSLSVGDLVRLRTPDGEKTYLVASFGFNEVTPGIAA
jgi:hypothetical protein